MYKMILTKKGYELIQNSIENVDILNLSKLVFADNEIEVVEDTNQLENIVYEAYISHKENLSHKEIELQAVIPVWEGGFEINRVGILDIDKNLIALGEMPRTYKPTIDEGASKEIEVRVRINVDSADNISITIDPTVTLVTHEALDSAIDVVMNVVDGKVEYSELDDAIEDLIGAAPETLNTLNELAEALGNDPNFATTMTKELANKVDKEEGKGLSTNDFTDLLKSKLELLEHITKVSELQQDIPYLLDKDLDPLRLDITGNTNLINSEIERVIGVINALDIPEEVDLTPIYTELNNLKDTKLDKSDFETQLTTVLEELKTYLESEFTKVNTAIDKKANKEDIITKISLLEDDLNINTRLTGVETNKASKIELNQVKTDLETMIDNIDFPETDLSEIEAELLRLESTKANKTDVETSLNKIIDIIENQLKEQLATINKALESKANQSEIARLETMIGSLGELTTTEKTSIIKAINELVNIKANKTDLPTKVGQLENDKGYVTQATIDFTDINNQISTINTKVDKKADKTELNNEVAKLNSLISNLDTTKANQSEIARLDDLIANLDIPEGVDLKPVYTEINILKESKADKDHSHSQYVSKTGDSMTGTLNVKTPSFPVARFERETTATGNRYGAINLVRSGATPVDGIGIGFYFKNNNSSNAETHSGFFGGALDKVQSGNEVGQLVFAPAFKGQDPYSRKDFTLTALNSSESEANFQGQLKVNSKDVALKEDIPTHLSHLIDNSSSNPIKYAERVRIFDTRNISDTPLDIMKSGSPSLKFDFKYRNRVGNPDIDISANGSYAHILTVYGWTDNTGGYPTQISFGQEKVGIRTGISDTTWSPWRKYSDDEALKAIVNTIKDEVTSNEYEFTVRDGKPYLRVTK